MFTHDAARRIRRSLLSLSVAVSLVLCAALVTPAAADTPTAWENAPDVSPLGFLLVLVIIPLGIAAVLALLTILPSMASDRGYEPGQAWRGEAEWFGGPTRGVRSAAEVTPEQIETRSKDTGGTSANW
ncbi:MAG: hypothetical protein JWQ67_2573 [Marmoricola sp.]|nr:hypothetical protein [Marmoricola sp.]MCW2828957.1 hypothetical protein [Marmoricola sp.]